MTFNQLIKMDVLSKSVLLLLVILTHLSSSLFTKVNGNCVYFSIVPCEREQIESETLEPTEITPSPEDLGIIGTALKSPNSCGLGYYQDKRGNCRKKID